MSNNNFYLESNQKHIKNLFFFTSGNINPGTLNSSLSQEKASFYYWFVFLFLFQFWYFFLCDFLVFPHWESITILFHHYMVAWHFGTDQDPRIHITDLRIQIQIRTRIRRQWPFKCQQKLICFLSFLLITFWRYIYTILKWKKSQRSHKTVEIKVFLFLLLYDGRIRIQILILIRTI